jgi:hypothetical protein
LRELLDQRDGIDTEIAAIVTGTVSAVKKERKPLTCGACGQEGHTARTCPTKLPQ